MVEYPSRECTDGNAHYWIELSKLGIWRCKYCWAAKWLPRYFTESIKFTNNIHRWGLSKAYKVQLDKMPEVKNLLELLYDLRSTKSKVSEDNIRQIVITASESYVEKRKNARVSNKR